MTLGDFLDANIMTLFFMTITIAVLCSALKK